MRMRMEWISRIRGRTVQFNGFGGHNTTVLLQEGRFDIPGQEYLISITYEIQSFYCAHLVLVVSCPSKIDLTGFQGVSADGFLGKMLQQMKCHYATSPSANIAVNYRE